MKGNTKDAKAKDGSITTLGVILLVILVLGLMLALAFGLGMGIRSATRPEDPQDDALTFTMESPAPYPVLNAIIDNPLPDFADERDSLKIMEYGAAGTSRDAFGHYTTEMTLEAGRRYSLVIHVHNDADEELGEDGMAEGVQFTVNYPTVINGDANMSVLLSAENTTPMVTGSSINLHTDEKLRIEFVDKTGELLPVKQYNYAMKYDYELAVDVAVEHDTGTITGNVGRLMPGYELDSGAYIFLWFTAEAVK